MLYFCLKITQYIYSIVHCTLRIRPCCGEIFSQLFGQRHFCGFIKTKSIKFLPLQIRLSFVKLYKLFKKSTCDRRSFFFFWFLQLTFNISINKILFYYLLSNRESFWFQLLEKYRVLYDKATQSIVVVTVGLGLCKIPK